MTPQVIVSNMACVTVVDPFHKGWHAGNHRVVLLGVIQVQFVGYIVGSLKDNSVEEVSGHNNELVGRAKGCLELGPFFPSTNTDWDTCQHIRNKTQYPVLNTHW